MGLAIIEAFARVADVCLWASRKLAKKAGAFETADTHGRSSKNENSCFPSHPHSWGDLNKNAVFSVGIEPELSE